ncbi:MAG: type II toxin-antitoxin system HipA family toxin [Pseudobdellovibrio sp.]
MNTLYVWMPPNLVGKLQVDKNDTLTFQYEKSWEENPKAFALSNSLKLDAKKIYGKEADFFFSNLLPEGNARESLCRKMGISIDNNFELLSRIGRDCAGALILTEEDTLIEENADLKKVSIEDLKKWLSRGSGGLLDMQVQGELRLSLAGAQNKLPIVYINGEFYQPLGSHPTTHILKPPPDRFKYIPENEWFQSRLAFHMGFNVANSKLIKIGSDYSLLVERYDREQSDNQWKRLHQEDFCQALGVSGKKKYQIEGGPSAVDCVNLISLRSDDALEDTNSLIRWLIFNVLIGNCDAHAKNVSLLRQPNGIWGLAPLYDLVATRIYDELSHNLAMSVDSQYDSGTIYLKHWKNLFSQCTVSPARYTKEIKNMTAMFNEKINIVTTEFNNQYGDSPVIQILHENYKVRLRRVLTGINKYEN